MPILVQQEHLEKNENDCLKKCACEAKKTEIVSLEIYEITITEWKDNRNIISIKYGNDMEEMSCNRQTKIKNQKL